MFSVTEVQSVSFTREQLLDYAAHAESYSPHPIAESLRKAMDLLRTTDKSIADVAAELGYRSQSRIAEAFRDAADVLPTDYRKNCDIG